MISLTDKNFTLKVLENPRPVLVMFTARWSGPSHMLTPVFTDTAAAFSGKAVFGRLDVDRNPRTAARFDVAALPTLLFFRDGSVVERINGVISKIELTNKIECWTF